MTALASPMLYHLYTPRPPLADFVNVFWLYQGSVLPHAKERLLPTGTVELVINLNEDTLRIYDPQNHDQLQGFPGSLVCGPHSEFFVIDTPGQDLIVGVHFKPGGAFPFFNLPADELHNTHVSLDTLWGTEAGYLRERLLAAATPQAKFAILEQVLLAQAARPLAPHPAVVLFLKELQSGSYARPLGSIIEQIGLSRRRFIQLFRAEVGLTPKLFNRVQRFQEVLRRIGSGQPFDWTDTALTWGYFDQAHFIHDFQAFSGFNPTAYLARRSEHLNHVPLYD